MLEVLRRSKGAFLIYEPQQTAAAGLQNTLAAVTRAMQAMLPTLERHATAAGALGEEDAQRLARWAEVAGSLVEAYTQLLWLDPEVSDTLRPAYISLLYHYYHYIWYIYIYRIYSIYIYIT